MQRLTGAERLRFARDVICLPGSWRAIAPVLAERGWPEWALTEGRIKAARRDIHKLEARWGKKTGGQPPVTVARGQRVTRHGSRPVDGHRIGRIAVFDIETTDLAAVGRQGFLVCCSILPLEADEPYTLSLAFGENSGSDNRLLADVLAELARYDILVGHNICAFDLNWLNTRRALHGLPAMRRWYVFDTYQVAKSMALRVTRKSLAFLCDAYGVECVKTGVYPASWHEIRSSVERDFRTAMDDIVYHCEQDVLSNRRLFERLWPDAFGLANSALKLYKVGNVPERTL